MEPERHPQTRMLVRVVNSSVPAIASPIVSAELLNVTEERLTEMRSPVVMVGNWSVR